jgi:hydrogen cyanide synthase HcnC
LIGALDAFRAALSHHRMRETWSDAIVIGGGLVGAAIAWGLTGQGLRTVLLDEGDVAYRASRGNFGLVWVQSKGLGAPHYQRWTRASAGEWRRLAGELGGRTGLDLGLRQPGGVQICLSEQEFEERAERMERMRREAGNFGFEHRMIRAGEGLRDMLPGLGPRVVGASWTPYDGHANPLALLHALHCAVTEAGGAYLPGAKVEAGSAHAAPRDFAVTAADGRRFAAPRVVLAAGLGNAGLAPRFGLSAPVRPQRGQVIVTERAREVLPMPLTTIRQTTEGSVMLGDSVEEVGFDTRQRPEVIKVIAERAVATFPWIAGLNIVRAWSALRVMAPDGLPIYDQSEEFPGAFTANCHSGVTLAGAHARLLAPMIAAGRLDPMLDPFSARRFGVRQAA